MTKRLLIFCLLIGTLPLSAQKISPIVVKNAGGRVPNVSGRKLYVPPEVTKVSLQVAKQVERNVAKAASVHASATSHVNTVTTPGISKSVSLASHAHNYPLRRNRLHKRYPSGLLEEEQLISDWLEYFTNGYFRPRDQVEAIEGMTPKQMNNIIEYLYYMPLEEAREIILNPLRDTGRLPDFMYDNKLIPGTQRLPSGYYKNKFNENIATFVKLAEEDGSVFTHNAQLKELVSTMKDYTFKQGFTYKNCPELTSGLRKNWEAIMAEIRKPGINSANRTLVNQMWNQPVPLPDGTSVSLKQYFTQTRKTAFFEKAVPEFYLNSPKWVALENERRNLIAQEYPFAAEDVSAFNRLAQRLVLGKPDKYLTLEQFGALMTDLYKDTYGDVHTQATKSGAVSIQDDPLLGLKAQTPTSTTIKVNNFDKLGGVCQMSFTDGGYMGNVKAGYDGTSTVARFDPIVFEKVRVVTFDMQTLQPRVVTLDKVSYVKDLKQPDVDRVRASSMVGDGLDASRDVLTVQRAEKALRDIPHLRATIYPQSRVPYADKIPYMKGGGLAAYLALFTPDFYPIKTVRLLKKVDGKWTWVSTHFIRKEVLTHAGFVHRDHLTFTEQVQDRIVPDEK